MGNISYFCIVKRFRSFLRTLLLIIFLLLTNSNSIASAQDTGLASMDSVEISLLTCQPRQNVYSLYGHTAIRIENRSMGYDLVVNYGLFNFKKPFFVLRFVFGLTDYEMGIESFADFQYEYGRVGCGVKQQVLRLSREDKMAILQAIDVNYRPENRVYRYNYFYDNCTTRARDILLRNMKSGKVMYASKAKDTTFRKMIHQYNGDHLWARAGNDLLLGVKADAPTSFSDQQFLPFNLSADFAKAKVVVDGKSFPLVTRTFWAIAPGTEAGADGGGFPLDPAACALLLLVVVLAVCAIDHWRKKISWGFDLILLLADGIAGLILLAMVFSEHPTVSLNLQILLLNPLWIVFLYPTIRSIRRRTPNRWLTIWPIFIVAFYLGAFFQSYAEGMHLLAFSLLVRTLFVTSEMNKNTTK